MFSLRTRETIGKYLFQRELPLLQCHYTMGSHLLYNANIFLGYISVINEGYTSGDVSNILGNEYWDPKSLKMLFKCFWLKIQNSFLITKLNCLASQGKA